MTKLHRLFLATALCFLLVSVPGLANALSLLINSQPDNPGGLQETRGASAILTVVDVGASDVEIAQFGTFGELAATGNVKFLIFSDVIGTSPLFSTAAIPVVGGGGLQWYDSPLLSFTLQANSTYQIGLIADQSFTYTYDLPGVVVSANGLTLDTGENGNAFPFGSPVTIENGIVVQSIRIFGVPEPTTALLLACGLVGLGVRKRLH